MKRMKAYLVLVAMGLIIILASCASNQEKGLVDLDLVWSNPYDRPVDQISIMVKNTGRMIVLDLVYDPYVEPGETGLFSATLHSEVYQEVQSFGSYIVNVRMR